MNNQLGTDVIKEKIIELANALGLPCIERGDVLYIIGLEVVILKLEENKCHLIY